MSSSFSQERLTVFDLDGTLIDSRPLVEAAYASAGVSMPSEAWGKPWREWLPDLVGDLAAEVHETKNLAYIKMLPMAIPKIMLPPARVATRLKKEGLGDTAILTGASRTPALIVGQFVSMDWTRIYTEATLHDKMTTLAFLSSMAAEVVYVDDDPVAVAAIQRSKLSDGVRVVHYTNQTDEQMMEAVWTR